jgi:hypothetical protein
MVVRLSALHAGSPLSRGRFLVLISLTGWVDPRAIVRLERLGQFNNPLTSSGNEPDTFGLIGHISIAERMVGRKLLLRGSEYICTDWSSITHHSPRGPLWNHCFIEYMYACYATFWSVVKNITLTESQVPVATAYCRHIVVLFVTINSNLYSCIPHTATINHELIMLHIKNHTFTSFLNQTQFF